MKAIDAVVWKETKYVALWVLIFSSLLQAGFLVAGRWEPSVLLGNLWSAAAVILNFFFLGLSVQKALEKEAEDAKKYMKLSQSYRFLFLAVAVILGILCPVFHNWAVLPPLLFPRIAIALRPLGKGDRS